MKAAWLSVVTGLAASVCCIGPVLAVAVGASALTAVAIRFEPFRPAFLTLTVLLLGFAFSRAYRPARAECADSVCSPTSNNRARLLVWLVAVVVLMFVTFPYYVGYLF